MKFVPHSRKTIPGCVVLRDRAPGSPERAGIQRKTAGTVLTSYLDLFKIRIALFAALSAATGSILADPDGPAGTLTSIAGVFVLACGAGALNQVQERQRDALMPRTRLRPIPSGRIKPEEASYTAIALIITGLLLLTFAGNVIISGLGIAAVLWYNLVYTSLKKRTAFAAVPGALTGMAPPAIGWISGGGDPADIRVLALCFFFFMWQVPHFWLLLLSHREDFEQAGLPSLTTIFGFDQLSRITAVWMSAAGISSLLIPFYGVTGPSAVTLLLVSAAAWLVWNSISLYRKAVKRSDFARAFRSINIYMATVMLLLSIGRVFSL